jgi:hypothetical protein
VIFGLDRSEHSRLSDLPARCPLLRSQLAESSTVSVGCSSVGHVMASEIRTVGKHTLVYAVGVVAHQ